ncbi:MAG TPA: argininosuccinate lyase, partial [Phycisphaerales bacterium]|nr:argininosuccinate lyase [Phycisphaerales bacterium]
ERAPAGPTAVGVPGAWPGWKVELEDVHMCIEAALVEKIGDAGRRLHTGRSRNDQVALDLRLWLREACGTLAASLTRLQASFEALARAQGATVLPTYTHLQRAQPAVLGAECMAWWAMFDRDRRLFEAMPTWHDALAASPLGSGAVAGSTLPLNRSQVARDLGFDQPTISSIDSTASRDEALDFLHACSRTAMHLSRLAEQWIIYATTEFSFLTLGEAYTTGSSMMPQKRNPDMLELIRGRCGTIYGHHTALSTILKGLPLAYNRDLQEDKRHVFAAFDTLKDSLDIAAGIVATARFNADRIAATLDRGHLDATVLAEYLVQRGVPFRTAHQIVGHLVRLCDKTKRHSLALLDLDEIKEACRAMGQPAAAGEDVFEHLGVANVVNRYRSLGHAGTSRGGYTDWLGGPTLRAASSPPPHSDISNSEAASPPAKKPSRVTAPSKPPSLFPTDSKSPSKSDTDLINGYKSCGRTLDDLPYTDEFETLFTRVQPARPDLDKYTLFRRLHNLRKAGKLPKTGHTATLPVKLQPKEESWLRDRVTQLVGSLGQRDQLPYDPRFDTLVEEFNAHTGRTLSPHDTWRVVAKLAK